MNNTKPPSNSRIMHMKTFVRLKPSDGLPPGKSKHALWKSDTNKIITDRGAEAFSFDHVFGEQDSNIDVFEMVIENEWSSLLTGVNMSVFTFGQTSSGKTYTMKGIESDQGLVPLALKRFFDKLDKKKDCVYRLNMSYYEIYNETVNDLLNPSNKNLDVREKDGFFCIPNLAEREIRGPAEALKLFKEGEKARSYATTDMNNRSSRSHVI